MNQKQYEDILAKVNEIRSRRLGQRNDAASNGTQWITINGTHIPIDAKGNIAGNSAVAKKIAATSKSSHEAGKVGNGGSTSSGSKKGAKDSEMHKAISSMSNGDIGDYLLDNGFDDEWDDWVVDKVNSKNKRDEAILKSAAKSVAAGKGDDFKRLSKANYWDKADYIDGTSELDHDYIADLAYKASHGSKIARLQLDTETMKVLGSLDD